MRHSFDNKIGNFKNAGLKIVHKTSCGDLGFLITYDVPASMKKNVYHVEVLVTGNNLCMSKCNCQAGGQGVERIVCVHTLVLPYLLTLMLTSGCLAEHILIELSNRWEVEWDTLLNDGKLRHLKEKVLWLVEATGNYKMKADFMLGLRIYCLCIMLVQIREQRKALQTQP